MSDDEGREDITNGRSSTAEASSSSHLGSQARKRKEYARIEPTTPEQLVQEDLINNCAVKTVISGIMGSALGVAFGVFMGAMDSAVSTPDKPMAGGSLHAVLVFRSGAMWQSASRQNYYVPIS
jgi:hypothetical protein